MIDWDMAELVPGPAAIQYPRFMADVPGDTMRVGPESVSYEEERQYYLKAIESLGQERPSTTRVLELLESSSPRQYFELSLWHPAVDLR